MNTKSKTVLVTGGTGFLGSYIIKELVEKGYAVKAIKRESSKIPFYISPSIFEKITWLQGDILDVMSLDDAMNDVDVVIHSAGMVSFTKAERKKMYRINVDGTANVVNMAIEKNIARFIHVSSVAAIGRTKTGGHVDETKKWEKSSVNTHYAISKHRAEIEVWRGIGEGLHAVIVNPSTILGYGDWNATSCRVFKTFYDEFPWYSTGTNGFVDIEDVARATVMLMETDIAEERFIINGDNWKFEQLFNTIAADFGKKGPGKKVTPFLGQLAWRIEKLKSLFTGKKPLLTKETARLAQSNTLFDNAKLLKALPGFSFTPLQESIKNACNKYLDTIN